MNTLTPTLATPARASLNAVIISLAIGSFCIGTTEFIAMGLIQEIAQGLRVTVTDAGHFISSYALGVTLGAPIIAIFAARIPRKMTLLVLMIFYGLANLATVWAHTSAIMLLARFIAGLPHGAYFGISALVVADLAGIQKRSSAIARMMMGLTLANVIGVPFATWLGQHFGWQSAFILSSLMALLAVLAIMRYVPHLPVAPSASIKSELAGLKNINMWLTLAVAAIGFGGMFAVYSFASPILTHYTGASIKTVPIALAMFGVGMVIGGLVAGIAADKNLNKTIVGVLLSSSLAFAVAYMCMHSLHSAMLAFFLIGLTVSGLGSAIQTRLIDVAGEAQALAASLNHSAFNLANALGAFLSGWVIDAQFGWRAPIWVGGLLSLMGLLIFWIAYRYDKRQILQEKLFNS